MAPMPLPSSQLNTMTPTGPTLGSDNTCALKGVEVWNTSDMATSALAAASKATLPDGMAEMPLPGSVEFASQALERLSSWSMICTPAPEPFQSHLTVTVPKVAWVPWMMQ